jgi:hypothetical protein
MDRSCLCVACSRATISNGLYTLGEFQRTTPTSDSHPVFLEMAHLSSTVYINIFQKRICRYWNKDFFPQCTVPQPALPGSEMWQGCVICRYYNYSTILVIKNWCVRYSRLQANSLKRLWNKENSNRKCYLCEAQLGGRNSYSVFQSVSRGFIDCCTLSHNETITVSIYKSPQVSKADLINDLHNIFNSVNTSHFIVDGDFNLEWRTGNSLNQFLDSGFI